MKRDLNLIREILLAIEAKPDTASLWPVEKMSIKGHAIAEIKYNLFLLYEAGYVAVYIEEADDELTLYAQRLTWQGHEFLDAARDNGRWKKVLSSAEAIGGLALDVLKPVLIDMARQALSVSLSIRL